MRFAGGCFALALFLASARPSAAAVAEVGDDHFVVVHEAELTAPAERAWSALVDEIGEWWNPAHTFGGDSRALSLDAKPQGCFCESLPNGGGVRHLTVINAAPAKRLVLTGALGPLQEHPVNGVMTWELEPAGSTTKVKMTYRVSGWVQGSGLRALAPAVDRVLGEQVTRYAEHVNR